MNSPFAETGKYTKSVTNNQITKEKARGNGFEIILGFFQETEISLYNVSHYVHLTRSGLLEICMFLLSSEWNA